jgi:multidrug efflux pump subunit AcrB
MLTSLTTFFGLAPLIFEQSIQAAFVIPMAVSLGFGVLVVTFIVLAIIPASYVIIDDIRRVTAGRRERTPFKESVDGQAEGS